MEKAKQEKMLKMELEGLEGQQRTAKFILARAAARATEVRRKIRRLELSQLKGKS